MRPLFFSADVSLILESNWSQGFLPEKTTETSKPEGVEYGSSVLFSTNLSLFQVLCSAKSFFPFYFWLDPKVTKAQEPIKGDFCCAKPRTLFTASCFYRVSVWFEFLIFCIGYIVTIFYYDSCSIPAIAIPLCAPPITGDGFGPLFLILYVWDFCPRSPPTPKGEPAR